MARATGSRAQLLGAFETVEYGTAATGNYQRLPFISSDLGGEQGIQNDDVLGRGRQPSDPSRGVITDQGNIVVPVDLRDIGFWLKLLLGAPATTNPSDYQHVFVGAADTLPSVTLEIGHPGVPKYFQNLGCMANSLQLQWSPDGQAQATVNVIAQGENPLDTSSGGTPTVHGYQRFHQFQGFIAQGGSPLGNITALDVTIANGLEPVRVIRSDGKIDGIDLGLLAVTGSLTARFADTALRDAAVSDTPVSLTFGWEISATKKLTIAVPELHLSVAKIPVQGPGGVSQQINIQAAKPDAAEALTVTLLNDVASY